MGRRELLALVVLAGLGAAGWYLARSGRLTVIGYEEKLARERLGQIASEGGRALTNRDILGAYQYAQRGGGII